MNKELFLKFYSNLPIMERRQVILDLKEKGGPISWEVAYTEIREETELGKFILDKLLELKLIPETEDSKK